jgi:uncharacterized protein YbjT (DUF2867 family)
MNFRVLIAGGTGQVGSAVVQALLATGPCREVILVTRRSTPSGTDARLRQVVMDTGGATFQTEVTALARSSMEHGEPLYAASCIGIGKGSQHWSEEDVRTLEIGVVGAFARGCLAAGVERFSLLSAAGSDPHSRIRYTRLMGEKEDAVRSLGFKRLTIVRPGIIAGNVHTPNAVALLGRLIPGPYGTIDQQDIGRAVVGQLLRGKDGVTVLHNAEIRRGARCFDPALGSRAAD